MTIEAKTQLNAAEIKELVKEKLPPEKLLSLPIVELRADAKESQKIKGSKGEVHYEITKVRVFPQSEIIIYSLSTSGPEEERRKFVEEIIGILGEPFNKEQQFVEQPDLYFTFWQASDVEERLRNLSV